MSQGPIQTRNHDGALLFHDTLEEAFKHAVEDDEVWKISFDIPTGERVRLIRDYPGDYWTYQDINGNSHTEVKDR